MNNQSTAAVLNNIENPYEPVAFAVVQTTKYCPAKVQIYYSYVKRLFDVLFSLAALVMLAPVMLLCTIVIRVDSKGSPVFKQQRVGQKGENFYIYKFRTMHIETPCNIATAELKNSQLYITRVGRFLRKTSLDELPQLINVLKGEMSIVGPRPLIPTETAIHKRREECGIYFLKPGITGLAQISGRDLIKLEKKVQLDYQYLKHHSFVQDLVILLKTIFVVFSHKCYAEGGEELQVKQN